MQTSMEYKASLDLTAKNITLFVTILFLGILGKTFDKLILENTITKTNVIILITIAVIIILVYTICFGFRITGYVLTTEAIIIKRPFKDVVLKIESVKDVFLAKKETMRWVLRTFGNGGLFGYFGEFRNGTFGAMTWYATRKSNYLILETIDSTKIVLTPDDITMASEIKKRLGDL
jgi:hypothetical protein